MRAGQLLPEMKTPPRGGAFNSVFQHVSGFAVHHPADHLAAAGRASAVRPADHLAAAGRASAVRPAGHLAAAGRASGWDFDFDSSYILSNVGSKRLNQIAPQAQKTTREQPFCSCAVPGRLANRIWNSNTVRCVPSCNKEESTMGRYMLLWLLGVPIPILVLIWMFGGLH
jgi:hypothetical protein